MAQQAETGEKTPLQLAVERALESADHPREHYDRIIQRRTGKTGKLIYDIQRGKSLKPGAATIQLIADAFGLPSSYFMDPLEAGALEPSARPFQMEGASAQRMRQDVPIFGTALGADEIIDGETVEQTRLNTGDIIGYLKRPVLLDGRADVYGIYVQGSSMVPRFHDGDTVFVERKKPPRIGDDVVVYLRIPDAEEGERTSSVLIKTLARKSASFIELQQYQPAHIFRLEMKMVERIDRVIPWRELVQ